LTKLKTNKRGAYITAKHPECGTLWAAVDPNCHHLEGKVEELRFSAFLCPFRSDDDARAALTAAGALVEAPHG
jgi:hypothetical protein